MKTDKMIPVIHLKTGKLYLALREVINCTNNVDGQVMIEYVNMDGDVFVREEREFWQKFQMKEDRVGE